MKQSLAFISVIIVLVYLSCTKSGGSFPPPPPLAPCSLVSVGLNGSVVNPSASGVSDGTITLTATGGNGFSFSLNGGIYQSTNKFTNLPAGNYTVIAKNSDGCTNSIDFRLTDPIAACTGVTVVVTATTTATDPCQPDNGKITVTASGGVTPYQYSLNGSAFQSSGYFNNVAAGSSVILVKDVNGCIGTTSVTVGYISAGPLFSQVKALVQYKCLYCHSGSTPAGAVSYTADCNIIAGQLQIKARAVDAVPSPMPASGLLPAADRQKIMDWINAGGRYSD